MKENNFATIMKYLGRDGKVHFIVEDKFQTFDMVDRHCHMENLKYILIENGEMIKHFYTKEVVQF